MPMTPRLLGDNHLLVVTHLGQVLRSTPIAGGGRQSDRSGGRHRPTDSTRGLADRRAQRPECPIAAAPAFFAGTGTIVVPVWQPGEPHATLTALHYQERPGADARSLLTADAVAGGVIAAPVFLDGATVYVNGRNRALWALNAADGREMVCAA